VALSQHGTVAPTTIHNRTDFAASMIDGRTVMEVEPEGKSAEEIVALWDYLHLRLMRRDVEAEEQREAAAAAPLAMPRNVNALGRPVQSFGRRVM
jgi:chromosome partitioning protein